MDASDKTWEAQQLNQQPAVRKQLAKSPAFKSYLEALPSIEIDGEKLYLPGGDVPMDADQIAYSWARDEGLIKPTKTSTKTSTKATTKATKAPKAPTKAPKKAE